MIPNYDSVLLGCQGQFNRFFWDSREVQISTDSPAPGLDHTPDLDNMPAPEIPVSCGEGGVMQ